MTGPAEAPILLLAGGKGTRLRAFAPDRPKPMVEVGGRPFLHWLVEHQVRSGATDFIVSTGHMAELVERYPWSETFPGASFRFHRETEPLGTGGAVRSIFRSWPELERTWVVNGDTLLPERLPAEVADADALYVALEAEELFDATPNLRVEGDRVLAEGSDSGRYFDGGSILVNRIAIDRYTGPAPCSIHQLLEPSMRAGRVGYRVVPGTCYDIGTPERFARFERYLAGRPGER